MKKRKDGLLRLIAVFKLFKAGLLIAVGIGALKLIHKDVAAVLDHLVAVLGLNPGGEYVDRAVGRVASLPPHKLREVGVGSFVYAGLFLTEAVGLWSQKRWGEWVTVVITGSLVPFEMLEVYRHPTVLKVLVLLINIAVVVYLVLRIRREDASKATA